MFATGTVAHMVVRWRVQNRYEYLSGNCECGDSTKQYTYFKDGYRRLSNGTCVLVSDPQCVAEFQPSPGFIAVLFTSSSTLNVFFY